MKSNMQVPCNKGSIVVEASLIFPIVFLIVVAVIYFCLIIYQKAYIQSLADIAVERGAAGWNNPTKDMSTGGVSKANMNSGGLYWRLIDFRVKDKEERVKEYIKTRLNGHAVLGFSSPPEVNVKMYDYIAYKVLEISINVRYKIPVGKVLKMFGLSEHYEVSVKSSAVINEPAEFIRNTDFVLNLEKEFEKSHPAYQNAANNIRVSMDNIKAKIDKFFKENEGENE